jgi:hypothetical protein
MELDTWFPLEAIGGAFVSIGKAMPSAWMMNGLQNILIRSLGSESVWMAAGMLLHMQWVSSSLWGGD